MNMKKAIISLATVVVVALSAKAGIGEMPHANLYVWKNGRVGY